MAGSPKTGPGSTPTVAVVSFLARRRESAICAARRHKVRVCAMERKEKRGQRTGPVKVGADDGLGQEFVDARSAVLLLVAWREMQSK